MVFGLSGYLWNDWSSSWGDLKKKRQEKERKERRILSDRTAEEPEQSHSFSKKAGEGKVELNRDPTPLGPIHECLSPHTAASQTLRFLDAVHLESSSLLLTGL